VVFKDSELSGFHLRLYHLPYIQVRFEEHKESGGNAACNVYFPRSQVGGLE